MLYNNTIPDFSVINNYNLKSILYNTFNKNDRDTYKDNLSFGKDIIHKTSLDWINSKLVYKKIDNNIILYNQLFIVNNTFLPNYCYIKIPSPAQLLEWLMIDTNY
jgi:hypothetical protein